MKGMSCGMKVLIISEDYNVETATSPIKSLLKWFEICPIWVTTYCSIFKTRSGSGFFVFEFTSLLQIAGIIINLQVFRV